MKLRLLPIIIFVYIAITLAKFSDVNSFFSDIGIGNITIQAEFNGKSAKADETAEEKRYDGELKRDRQKDQFNNTFVDRSNQKVSTEKPKDVINITHRCSDVDLDLLETLAARRAELKKWTKEAQNKANILKITEMKIDKKLQNLSTLRAEVKNLLNEYNQQEDLKIKSLVKIYESMKPKDAATIFEQLDMPVLLLVINNMKEAKVAPILAKVNPIRAKDITIKFANSKKLANPHPK